MCKDVLKQHSHLLRAYKKYMHEFCAPGETLEGVLTVVTGTTERNHSLSEEDAVAPNDHVYVASQSEYNSGKDTDSNFAHSLVQPKTASTDGATRHFSFASETTDASLYHQVSIDPNQARNGQSRNNSVDSDIFIQQFASNHALPINEKGPVHNESSKNLWKNGKKPVLESIISESALSLPENSNKYSLKSKPSQQQVS